PPRPSIVREEERAAHGEPTLLRDIEPPRRVPLEVLAKDRLRDAARPEDLESIDAAEGERPQPETHAAGSRGLAQHTPLVAAAGEELHVRAHGVPRVAAPHEPEHHGRVRGLARVPEELKAPPADEQEVELAVAIDVGRGDETGLRGGRGGRARWG